MGGGLELQLGVWEQLGEGELDLAGLVDIPMKESFSFSKVYASKSSPSTTERSLRLLSAGYMMSSSPSASLFL